MTTARTLPMGLHLPGLLSILGEHLYSDPAVALREALQNAHDSCERRAAESGDRQYQPRIEVRFSATERWLEVADNGSGLTEAEIAEFLATIGRSYTGELRSRLELGASAEVEAAASLIGQFGLGFLSAFLLARRVVLTTRSYRPQGQALRFVSSGGQTYELGAAPDEPNRAGSLGPIGSTLRMELKPAMRFMLDGELLERAIRAFADFLPTPIHLARGEGDEPEPAPVNRGEAPWHRGGGFDDHAAFVRDRFDGEPLSVLPLRDIVVPLGDDQVTVPLAGVLFVPPASVTSLHEFGEVAVYVRRMFICERERDLLPSWARFVGGVVESPRLRPTVSRESLRQDETFRQVQAGLEAQLVRHFEQLARDEPATWREIVLAHNDLIKGWALQSDVLFRAIADLVHFETSRGRMDLREVRAVTGDTLHYFSDEAGLNQDRLLYEARGLLVIDASRFAEEAFLKRYAQGDAKVKLEQLRPGTGSLFAPAESALPAIVAEFNGRGIACRAVRFEPGTLPALLVYPPGHDRVRRVRDVLDHGDVSGPVADLMRAFIEQRGAGGSGEPALHLNAGSPLLMELERRGPRDAAFAPALEMVYQCARFFAGKRMSADESRVGFERAMVALAALLGR